jgi:DNA polymerase-3 subunit beta
MKFTIDKSVYSGALDKVKKAVSKSEDDENLKYIYHDATSEGLRLVATDANIQIEYFIPVGEYLTVVEPGKTYPHGQKLSDLIKGFPNVHVEVFNQVETIEQEIGEDTEVEKFHLVASKSEKRKIAHWVPCGMKVKFPLNDFKFTQEKKSYKLNPNVLSTSLKKTQTATAKNLERPFLTHVCIDINKSSLTASGSDSQRIYWYSTGIEGNNEAGRILIYAPNIKEFLPLLDDENEIEIVDDKKVLVISQCNFKFSCRQMDAVEYPDWRRATAFETGIMATVNREELTNAIKNIMNITDFACTLVFDKDEQKVDVLVQPISGQAVVGGSDEEVPAIVDADISISVNPRYLYDALTGGKADNVTFKIKDNNSPFKLALGDGFECVISSMKLTKEQQ